jgi:hypothetical protein
VVVVVVCSSEVQQDASVAIIESAR